MIKGKITIKEADKFVDGVCKNIKTASLADLADAYVMAHYFTAKLKDAPKTGTISEVYSLYWDCMAGVVMKRLEECEKDALDWAYQNTLKVIRNIQAITEDTFGNLLSLSFAYLEIRRYSPNQWTPFWKATYNGSASALGIAEYCPGISFVSSPEELLTLKQSLEEKLCHARSEKETDELLEQLIGINKAMG